MGATSDTYLISTEGITYTISSEFVNGSHHQNVKIYSGVSGTANPVSTDYPFPVGICGGWGNYDLVNGPYNTLSTTVVGNINPISITTTGVTALSVTFGSVEVVTTAGSTLNTRYLSGGDSAGNETGDIVAVRGFANAYPVGITVGSPIPVQGSFTLGSSEMAIFGVSGATAIGVTFSTVNVRGISSATDSITVVGGGTLSTLHVGIFGFTGTSAAAVYSENNALNVNVKTFSGSITSILNGVTVSGTSLGIRNLDYTQDMVRVVGQGAADDSGGAYNTVPTYMNALLSNGNLGRVGGITGAGWSGAALNAYLVNSGISFTASVTLGTLVGISQDYTNPIRVSGSTHASVGIWVAGDTANGPVIVKGFSGGLLPVELQTTTLVTQTNFNDKMAQVKVNTDFLAATKSALYDSTITVGAFDAPSNASIHTLVKNAINNQLQSIANTVNTSTGTIGVAVEAYSMQPSFLARTVTVGNVAKNLTEYTGGAGYTCGTGVRIKVSRIATGANASQNEFMCVISEADAGLYGATAGSYSYAMYHGDELFVEIDNISKIKVFYPAYSASFAPHNTGSQIAFSFYAS